MLKINIGQLHLSNFFDILVFPLKKQKIYIYIFNILFQYIYILMYLYFNKDI